MPPPVFAQAQNWFDRSRAALLTELPCRQGCFRCCVGPFAITILDAAEIQRGLSHLDPEIRLDIEGEATRQASLMISAFPRLRHSPFVDGWEDAEMDELVSRFSDLRCPALSAEGSCRVYAFRPVTCRMMGIPVLADGLIQGACEVQTAVPIRPLPRALREEAERLTGEEAEAIEADGSRAAETEMLLPFGFLPIESA
jgi:Fe-S-cluster containining protein